MMDNIANFIGIAIMIASMIVSRIFQEKGLKTLTNEERGLLIGNFSKMRMTSVILIASMITLYLVVMYSGIGQWFEARHINPTVLYFAMLLLYSVTISIYTLKKQKEMGLPQTYIKNAFIANVVKFIGIASLCIGLYLTIWKP